MQVSRKMMLTVPHPIETSIRFEIFNRKSHLDKNLFPIRLFFVLRLKIYQIVAMFVIWHFCKTWDVRRCIWLHISLLIFYYLVSCYHTFHLVIQSSGYSHKGCYLLYLECLYKQNVYIYIYIQRCVTAILEKIIFYNMKCK